MLNPVVMRLAGTLLFLLALVVTFFQFPRSVDFTGYLHYVAMGLAHPPYPSGAAKLGDFFQSPVVAILLVPFTWLPLGLAKFTWAVMNAAGVVYVARSFATRAPKLSTVVFLLCLLAQPLSDVFLSGNASFLTLALVTFGWRSLEKNHAVRGGLALGLAIFVKLLPAVFVVWYLWLRRPRAALAIAGGAAFWFLGSFLFVSPEWWRAWIAALPLYPQAAFIGSESFQAPPSAIFRLTLDAELAKSVALALQASIFCLAFYRRSVPLLLTLFFLGNPYPWALTLLFLYPLLMEMAENEIPLVAWVGVLTYALLPKALWPEALWHQLVTMNLPAYGVLLAVGAAVIRQPYAARASDRTSTREPVGPLAGPLPSPDTPG